MSESEQVVEQAVVDPGVAVATDSVAEVPPEQPIAEAEVVPVEPVAEVAVRPWHGSSDPWESMYQFVVSELAKLRG